MLRMAHRVKNVTGYWGHGELIPQLGSTCSSCHMRLLYAWRCSEARFVDPFDLSYGLDSTNSDANLAADRALGYNRFIDPGAQTRMAT